MKFYGTRLCFAALADHFTSYCDSENFTQVNNIIHEWGKMIQGKN
jgi:hypothetical protein